MSTHEQPVGTAAWRSIGLWLIAFKGQSGSGKSTLSRAVAGRLAWPVIDKDDVMDMLDGHHIAGAGGLSYEVLFNVARRQLLQGLSVVCDSPFAYKRCYDHAIRITNEAQAFLAIIECECPDDAILRQRIEARQTRSLPAHHTTDWTAVEAFRQRTTNEGFTIAHPHLTVNTLQPMDALSDHIVQWLMQQRIYLKDYV